MEGTWGRSVLKLIAVAVVMLMLVGAVRLAEVALGPLDPNDPGYKVTVLDDGPYTVQLAGGSQETVTLRSGQRFTTSPDGPGQSELQLHLVRSGVSVGCLRIHLDPVATMETRVSAAGPCGADPARSVVPTIAALFLAVVLGGACIGLVLLGVRRTHRWLRRRGMSSAPARVLAGLSLLPWVYGGWLVLGLWLLVRAVCRAVDAVALGGYSSNGVSPVG